MPVFIHVLFIHRLHYNKSQELNYGAEIRTDVLL